jgi:hypothetical protein
VAWPAARYKTATAGGSWTPGDMNGVQDQYLRATGILQDDLDAATVADILGISQTASSAGGAKVRRGKSIIPTQEDRTNPAYGTMTTADRVQSLVLPTNGLIVVAFQAIWADLGGAGSPSAAIFVGANQLKVITPGGAPAVQEATITTGNDEHALNTSPRGLVTRGIGAAGSTTVVTTGTVAAGGSAGGAGDGGLTLIEAAAGTYDISVQFKHPDSTVRVRERKLWVWTIGF